MINLPAPDLPESPCFYPTSASTLFENTPKWGALWGEKKLKAYADAKVLEERERCAAICDANATAYAMAFLGREEKQAEVAQSLARAIRRVP